MKLKIIAVCLAVALSASADRVTWLPETKAEITNYAISQINWISLGICVSNGPGSMGYINLNKQRESLWVSGTPDLASVSVERMVKYVDYFLTNSDGRSVPPVEGKKYFLQVQWTANYDNDGNNYFTSGFTNGWNVGCYVVATGPEFTLTKVDGKFVVPPEAYNLSPDWFANSVGIVAVKAHPKWVDYRLHQGTGYTDFIQLTRNGRDPTCPGSDETNGFLHLFPYDIINGSIIPFVYPGGYNTITIWYDEGRTDGTEWRWDASGVHKREILPPQPVLSLATQGGSLKFMMTRGVPGYSYTLESVTQGGVQTQGTEIENVAIADKEGIAVWDIVPTNSSGFFRVRQN